MAYQKKKSFVSGFSFGCTKLQESQMSLAQFGRGTNGVHWGLHA